MRGGPEAPSKRRGRTLSSRARGVDTQAVHGSPNDLLGLAGLQSELKAISVRIKNNALIVAITGATGPIYDGKPGCTQRGC